MKVTAWVMTGRVGSRWEWTVDVDDDDLAECDTDEERNALIDQAVHEELHNHLEWGWREK